MVLRPASRPALDKSAILRAHPLFGKLGPDVIDRLASHAHTRTARSGTIIFQKGDPGDCLFAVCSGTVKIIGRSLDGKDAVFNLIDSGAIFGEIALLDGRERTAEAQALTDCTLMVINRRDFLPIIAGHPDLALRLIELLCARLRHTSEQVADIIFLDLPARLAKALLRLTDNSKFASGKVAITQREIGQLIGMTRESTNKQLRAWEERQWLRLERGSVVVIDRDQIAAVAATEAS